MITELMDPPHSLDLEVTILVAAPRVLNFNRLLLALPQPSSVISDSLPFRMGFVVIAFTGDDIGSLLSSVVKEFPLRSFTGLSVAFFFCSRPLFFEVYCFLYSHVGNSQY